MSKRAPLRIKGLVASANHIRNQINLGLSLHDLQQVRNDVEQTLKTVDRICSEAKQSVSQLPAPSRKAYDYLLNLDLSSIAITDQAAPLYTTLRIPRVQSHRQALQNAISQLALASNWPHIDLQSIQQKLQETLEQFDAHCHDAGLTPAHLSGQSRATYAWMKVLQTGPNLANHIAAVHQVHRAVQILLQPQQRGFSSKGGTFTSKDATVEFMNMSGLYRYRFQKKARQLQVNEGFINGDETIMTALGTLLIKGKSRKADTLLRKVSTSEEYCEIQLALELAVESIIETAQGEFYDLQEIFDRVNQDYFQGKIEQPHLSWSATHTCRKFGHYEPSRHRIVLSRTLDQLEVPAYVIDFVMYHELLHIKHGEIWENGRCRVHTPAFRKEERQFRQYEQAETGLTKVALSS